MSYFIKAMTQQYADFHGRARRTEYWMCTLFLTLTLFVAVILDSLMETSDSEDVGLIFLIVVMGVFVPGLAVQVRRPHDVGKSGWFSLLSLIPLVGTIWLLVLLCMDSQPGANQYGPNPKITPVEAGNSAAPSRFCSQCGSPRQAGAAFCGACGQPV